MEPVEEGNGQFCLYCYITLALKNRSSTITLTAFTLEGLCHSLIMKD